MRCRGIRGATVAASNTKQEIVSVTGELLARMIEANEVPTDEVTSIFFSTTRGLNAEFPAVAARKMGFVETPLLCGHEMEVPDSLQNCVRVLLLFNTEKKPGEISHIYIRGAEVLRPDANGGARRPLPEVRK